MNLETLDLLSSKVEKALETIRSLKAEKLRLDEQVASLGETNKRLRVELDEKDRAVAMLGADLDKRNAELQLLHETVQDRDGKIQMAAERLEHVMNTLEIELGTALNLDLSTPATPTVSAMSAEQAASLFAPPAEELAPVPQARAEVQPSFFDYGGTNP
jgi:chromosome segregation ATPase